MEDENDQVKQQSEQHMQDLEKRRILEQRRADFFAQRQRELEEAQRAKEEATQDKQEKQNQLKQQIMLAKRISEGRSA